DALPPDPDGQWIATPLPGTDQLSSGPQRPPAIPEALGRFGGKPRSPYRIDPFLQKTEVLLALFGWRPPALSLGSGDVRESNLAVREIDLDSQRRRPVVSAHRCGPAHEYG